MSDVRSLLRNERAARRVKHPQAQYSISGALSCKACRTPIKSETLWQSHLTSAHHVNTLKQLAASMKPHSNGTGGMKRKAEDEDRQEEDLTSRKRVRGETEQAQKRVHFEEPQQAPSPPAEATTGAADDRDSNANADLEPSREEEPSSNKHGIAQQINEDEWAAFERDVATPPPDDKRTELSKNGLGTVISAAPLSAAEIAAKSREEDSVQDREQRHAEIEGEKEDAQRRLEEEFDHMEELEERVKRLKDKREALRQHVLQKKDSALSPDVIPATTEHVESDLDDSDFDDEWDNWGQL